MTKKKPFFKNEKLAPFRNIENEFRAEIKEGDARLYIYGDIGESWWGDSTSASDVKDFLDDFDGDQLHVHINSLGGDVFDGIAIHNQLKNHEAEIIVHIDGIAASAASVIAMAGDKIKMPATAMMMIHQAWTIALGNANDFRKMAEDLDKIGSSLIAAYEPRFVGTTEELKQLLDDETFLTAAEAVSLGLADEEVEEAEEEAKEPVLNSVLKKYAKSKPKVAAKLTDEPKPIISRFKR